MSSLGSTTGGYVFRGVCLLLGGTPVSCTWSFHGGYATGIMPLAVKQEDFLVKSQVSKCLF